MEDVEIQVQDNSGMWRTYQRTQNQSQRILSEMQRLKSQFPGQRVRAVNQNGTVVDILG